MKVSTFCNSFRFRKFDFGKGLSPGNPRSRPPRKWCRPYVISWIFAILQDETLLMMYRWSQWRRRSSVSHCDRRIFITTGVRQDPISLPRQHSMMHYPLNIRKFGTPNGLCTSITESKHIKAVKEPWRRSNQYNTLSQMLISNPVPR